MDITVAAELEGDGQRYVARDIVSSRWQDLEHASHSSD